jgi:putative Mg2+ transporter-C (MgtC) family protein
MTEWEALGRVALALVAGAILGLEREMHDKPAGLRTYALVSQGAALFMVLDVMLANEKFSGAVSFDPSRMTTGVVQGIGFLAGGVIFTMGARVRGLTTAAGIWIAAAIGLLIGSGYYVLGFGGVVLTLLTLESLSQVGMRIPVRRDRIQNPEQSQP